MINLNNKKNLLFCTLLSFSSVLFAAEGNVSSVNKKGIISIVINGEAAKEIDKTLQNVHRISQGMGTSQSVVAKGKQISCSIKASKTECSLTIDDNGTMNATLYSSTAASSGKASTQTVDGRLQISISGKSALVILNAMKNVTTTGTMTTKKESGDIRCLVVREFKSESGTCSFLVDSSGSAASK